MKVRIDGELKEEIQNLKPVSFDKIYLYAGHPAYNPADAQIKNFVATSAVQGKYVQV